MRRKISKKQREKWEKTEGERSDKVGGPGNTSVLLCYVMLCSLTSDLVNHFLVFCFHKTEMQTWRKGNKEEQSRAEQRRAMWVWWQFFYPLATPPQATVHLSFNIKHLSVITPPSHPSVILHPPVESCSPHMYSAYTHSGPINTWCVCVQKCSHGDTWGSGHSVCMSARACACVDAMTVSSLKPSPTQTLDNSQISTLSPSSEDKGGGWRT